MTSTAQAIREMVKETCNLIRANVPDYTHATTLYEAASLLSDDTLLTKANAILTPLSQHIRSKDVAALSAALPEYGLADLVQHLPVDVVEKMWRDTNMLVMLLTTVSMVPPEMLRQIEGFANAMANNINGSAHDVGSNLGAMFGDMFAAVPGATGNDTTDPPVARGRRNARRRAGPKTAQQRFRDQLC